MFYSRWTVYGAYFANTTVGVCGVYSNLNTQLLYPLVYSEFNRFMLTAVQLLYHLLLVIAFRV